MRPSPENIPSQLSTTVLKNTLLKSMHCGNAALGFSKSNTDSPWHVVKESPWRGRSVMLHSVKEKILNFCRRRVNNPGKQLFSAYISAIEKQTDVINGGENPAEKQWKQIDDPRRMKVASAFILTGALKESRKKKLALSSSKVAINLDTLKQIDRFIDSSPVRLAYEFLAQNKVLPRGYLKNVLQPEFIRTLTNAGFSKDMAGEIVADQLRQCSLVSEKHISLETMMEMKNRLRQIIRDSSEAGISPKPPSPLLSDKPAGPGIDRPRDTGGYICDEDDTWLIKHMVDNTRTLRIAGDFARRTMRWAQRNKRTQLFMISGLAVEILVGGLFTGGIGAAVAAVASIGTTLAFFILSESTGKIRSTLFRSQLKEDKRKIEAGAEDPPMAFDSFLDKSAYLVGNYGVTNILNSYKNFENSALQVKKLHQAAESSVRDRIRFQRAHTLMQMRLAQLKECFETDAGSYDTLMITAVEEISRLDAEFNEKFSDLWKPFEKMEDSKRWDIFNKAANSHSMKKIWYGRKPDGAAWIQEITDSPASGVSDEQDGKDKNTPVPLSARIKNAFKTHPIATDNKKQSNTRQSLLRKTRDVTYAAGSCIVDLITRTALSSASLLEPSSIIKTGKISIRNFSPKQFFGPTVFIWAYYCVVSRISTWANRKMNQSTVKELQVQNADKERTFGPVTSTPSSNQWNSIRREAKDSMEDFINTLKQLRQEQTKILDELSKAGPVTEPMTEKKELHYAKLLLRRKMLEHKLTDMLAGAIGHMHQEIICAVECQKEAVKSMEVL